MSKQPDRYSVKGKKEQDEGRMPMSAKGIRLLLVGLAVIVSGFILLAGGGSDDPDYFNWSMFNFTRLTAAPILIVAGIVIEIVAIIGRPVRKGKDQ